MLSYIFFTSIVTKYVNRSPLQQTQPCHKRNADTV